MTRIAGLDVLRGNAIGRVDLRRFYARRGRRLLPALVVLAAGFALVTLTIDPLGEREELARTVAVMLSFTGNLPFAHGSDASFHVWTLRVTGVLVAAVVGCLLACVAILVWLWPHVDLAYALPTSWAVCFVVGAAARLRGQHWSAPAYAVPLAVAGWALLSVVPLRGHALTYLAGGPTIAALTAVLLLAWRTWTSLDGALPAVRALALLGTVSYGAYLWNYPRTLWLRPELGALAGPIAFAATLGAAALSWRYVERPLLRRPAPDPTAVPA